MVTSKIQQYEKPTIEEKRIPEEVLRLQSLLLDNGRKMMVERLSGTIVNSQKTINKPLPLGLTKEQKETYYDDMERIKIKIEVYEKLLQLPHIMMEEYGESEFRVNMSDNV